MKITYCIHHITISQNSRHSMWTLAEPTEWSNYHVKNENWRGCKVFMQWKLLFGWSKSSSLFEQRYVVWFATRMHKSHQMCTIESTAKWTVDLCKRTWSHFKWKFKLSNGHICRSSMWKRYNVERWWLFIMYRGVWNWVYDIIHWSPSMLLNH